MVKFTTNLFLKNIFKSDFIREIIKWKRKNN